MKLWETNVEFERMIDSCVWDDERKAWVDQDTGEIMTDDEFWNQLQGLEDEHDRIIEWCVKMYLDDLAKAEMIKSEVKRLQGLQKYHERRAERMKFVVDREQAGKPHDFGFAKVSYRKSKPVTWDDANEQKIIAWLLSNDHKEAVKTTYEIRKTELGKLIDDGAEVTKWARKEEKNNINIK